MDQPKTFLQSTISDRDFVRKTLIVLGLVVLALLLWQLSSVLLLAFGATLAAIVFHSCAALLSRYLHVPERWSLALATLLIFAAFLGLAVLFGTQIRSQFANVAERLPFAIDNFSGQLGFGPVTDDLNSMLKDAPAGGLASRLAGIGGTILGGVANAVLVIVAGIYIAASPRTYLKGLVKLFPKGQHERVESSLRASGEALRLWLVSQLIAMVCVGILSGFAYWLIGLPSPFALGTIAGLTDFIPFLGPFLGAAPAVMIAFTVSGEAALWTMLAALVIQQIEGNIIQPIVARRVISTPPALALFAIVAGSLVFGTLGLFFGYPLAIVVFVLVKKLYVRETLGERTDVPGEDAANKAMDQSSS
jgi:predicted PurR-regulated permease PerM